MKKWENPNVYEMGVKETLTDTSYCHECHSIHDNCEDFTNGNHGSHTTPEWNDAHGHTCCCPSNETVPPES